MAQSRSIERDTGPLCSFDEQRKVIIHRFDAGKCKCRCGKKVIRQPVKRYRLEYGTKGDSPDFE